MRQGPQVPGRTIAPGARASYGGRSSGSPNSGLPTCFCTTGSSLRPLASALSPHFPEFGYVPVMFLRYLPPSATSGLRERAGMVQRVSTVAFEGIEARSVDVQVQVAPGLPAFAIVGLPDKAVSEARERVRSALIASGLALPARRITVNLAPADLPKEGSHYDLPIALGLMAAIGAIPPRCAQRFYGARRTRARWIDRAGRGRVAGGDRRQFARRGPDLPGGLRRGSGLGEPGYPDHRGEFADPDRQPLQRHAGAVAAAAESAGSAKPSCSICATSRARKAPSARSRSRRPADIIC